MLILNDFITEITEDTAVDSEEAKIVGAIIIKEDGDWVLFDQENGEGESFVAQEGEEITAPEGFKGSPKSWSKGELLHPLFFDKL